MSIYYIYRTICKTTGQFYIGSRLANSNTNRTPEEDLFVKYFTSSKRVKALIKQHGVESFDNEFLLTSDNDKLVFWLEQVAIRYAINNPLCLNMHYHDPFRKDAKVWHTFGTKRSTRARPWNKGLVGVYTHSEETRKKMSQSRRGRVAHNKGVPRTKETKEKISAALKGKPVAHTGRPSPKKGVPYTAEQLANFRAKLHNTLLAKKAVPHVIPHVG